MNDQTMTANIEKKYLFIITGRRWFQRSYGNTYHTVAMEVRNADGDTVYTHKSGERYGYGEHFIQTAVEYLEKEGYLDGLQHYSHGGNEPLYAYCERMGYQKPIISAIDVTRERDL